jgi:hypothetical protein
VSGAEEDWSICFFGVVVSDVCLSGASVYVLVLGMQSGRGKGLGERFGFED